MAKSSSQIQVTKGSFIIPQRSPGLIFLRRCQATFLIAFHRKIQVQKFCLVKLQFIQAQFSNIQKLMYSQSQKANIKKKKQLNYNTDIDCNIQLIQVWRSPRISKNRRPIWCFSGRTWCQREKPLSLRTQIYLKTQNLCAPVVSSSS